jgi:hypothetical protein
MPDDQDKYRSLNSGRPPDRRRSRPPNDQGIRPARAGDADGAGAGVGLGWPVDRDRRLEQLDPLVDHHDRADVVDVEPEHFAPAKAAPGGEWHGGAVTRGIRSSR